MYVFSFLYNIAKPIFIAFVLFLMIEPLAKFLNKRKLKKITATTISMLIFIVVILGIIITLGVVFTSQIYHLSEIIPKYIQSLQEVIENKADYFKERIDTLPPETIEKGKGYLIDLAERSSALLSNLLKYLFFSLTSISNLIINFIIGLILAYFLSIEIDSWKKIAREKTPNTFKQAYFFLKDNVISGIAHYLKAQMKLITITFIIVFTGLIILGINNSFSIALLSAFFDLLPLLGVSSIFIPWIVYLVIVGKSTTALWLLVLLAVVIIVRQIAEPKIVGDSLGVSAFTMLSFMVISLSLFGVAGIILSPILLILIKALYEQGYLKRWIHLPEDEYTEM